MCYFSHIWPSARRSASDSLKKLLYFSLSLIFYLYSTCNFILHCYLLDTFFLACTVYMLNFFIFHLFLYFCNYNFGAISCSRMQNIIIITIYYITLLYVHYDYSEIYTIYYYCIAKKTDRCFAPVLNMSNILCLYYIWICFGIILHTHTLAFNQMNFHHTL